MPNDMRDRLIEIIKKFYLVDEPIDLADYLIANGVILPPCKVGDKIYKIMKKIIDFFRNYWGEIVIALIVICMVACFVAPFLVGVARVFWGWALSPQPTI